MKTSPSMNNPVNNNPYKTLTLILYILYILAIFSAGILAIVALVINYVKQDQVKGSIYASHFTWQIRSFWWYIIWNIIAFIPFIFIFFTTENPEMFYGVVFGAGSFCIAVMCLAWVWIVYRAIRGILALNDDQAMYGEFT